MKKYFDIKEPGFNIRCKLFCEEPRSIQNVVLFCHGFAGHKDTLAAERFSHYLLDKYRHYAVLAFDWPCHGEDVRKKLCLADCNHYLERVISYVQTRYVPETISACATSFGGYLVLKYIYEHGNPFHKIALRCPAVCLYEAMMRSIVKEADRELLTKGKDAEVGFDRKIRISNAFLQELRENDIAACSFLDCADDLFIVHGTKDEIIPIEQVRHFAEENVIEFLPVQNADHRFIDPNLMNLAVSRMAAFLAQDEKG